MYVGFPLNDIENWHWSKVFFKTCFYVVWFLSKKYLSKSKNLYLFYILWFFASDSLSVHNKWLDFMHEDVQRLFVWCYLLWYISIFLILLGGMYGPLYIISKLKSWKSSIQRSRKFNVYWKKISSLRIPLFQMLILALGNIPTYRH